MVRISNTLINRYLVHLKTRGVAVSQFTDYQKWLRYFLDYCEKYQVTGDKPDCCRLFMDKLREKNAGVLTVHGKGKKDRTVPLPEAILAELKAQMKVIGRICPPVMTEVVVCGR